MYHGSCHCNNIQFTVDAPITQVMECNCSHCSRKGFLLTMVPSAQVSVQSITIPLSRYLFHKHEIMHDFCPTCGVQCFATGINPADGSQVFAVNVRTLTDIDVASLEVLPVDGKSL